MTQSIDALRAVPSRVYRLLLKRVCYIKMPTIDELKANYLLEPPETSWLDLKAYDQMSANMLNPPAVFFRGPNVLIKVHYHPRQNRTGGDAMLLRSAANPDMSCGPEGVPSTLWPDVREQVEQGWTWAKQARLAHAALGHFFVRCRGAGDVAAHWPTLYEVARAQRYWLTTEASRSISKRTVGSRVHELVPAWQEVIKHIDGWIAEALVLPDADTEYEIHTHTRIMNLPTVLRGPIATGR